MNGEDDFEEREILSENKPAIEHAIATVKPKRQWNFALEVMDLLALEWEKPDRFIPTSLRSLDGMLYGGLRAGECLALAGIAGGGKSALAGQIAVETARHGAAVIYASVEMPASEVFSRCLAREMFLLADPSGTSQAVGYSDVMFGRAWRGEGFLKERHVEVLGRLERARQSLREAFSRFVVKQVSPGATVTDLAEMVREVREESRAEHVVLVVDPIQRLYAGESGSLRGRALDSLNANETERVGTVVQALKHLADSEGIATIFTSDTTKAHALEAKSGALALRGSYQLTHLATAVLSLHTAEDCGRLAEKVKGAVEKELDSSAIQAGVPSWWAAREDLAKLGPRYSVIECSKNRRGPKRDFSLGFVAGACAFFEGEEQTEETTTKASKTAKKAKKKVPSASATKLVGSEDLTEAAAAWGDE